MRSAPPFPRALWLALVVLLTMSGAFAQGCSCSRPPPVPLEGEEPKGPLVFPPSEDGWKTRSPIKDPGKDNEPRGTAAGGHATKHFDVRLPRLDKDGRFEQIGTVVEISFDDDAVLALDKAPVLQVTPAVNAKTVWTSASSVELRADKPFDPNVEFTITIPELTGPSGKTMPGWKGIFRAKPETVIAGKTVHWIPKPGVPRVVYVRPIYDREIGPDQESIVLFDQPVDDAMARSLITLTNDNGGKIPLGITHPPPGNTFEGQKVDTKQIVIVKMTAAPPPKTKLTLTANGKEPGDQPITRTLTIADPPKFKDVSCDCDVKGTTMTGHVASMPTLNFTNYVKHDKLETKVTVTPKPPNLSIGGWGDYVSIDASWTPSTTYQISAQGLSDKYGYAVPAVSATFIVRPRTASAILREGVLILDEQGAKDFFVTTRNVKKGELAVWTIGKGGDALAEALKLSQNNEPPKSEPKLIPFDGAPDPHTFVRTSVDLGKQLSSGNTYLAQVRLKEPAHGAKITTYTNGSDASKPSVPLILLASKDAIGAHAHAVAGKAVVTVYRLASGDPVANAEVSSSKGKATTDAGGTAIVDFDATSEGAAIVARAGTEETTLPFISKITTSASSVYPSLAENEWEAPKTDLLGFIITDKGIYRPGGTLDIKGIVRKQDPKNVGPAAKVKVRLKVQDPNGTDTFDDALVTNDLGVVTKEAVLPTSGSRTGKYKIRLELDDNAHTLVAEETVRVAEFETPRFKVDVEVPEPAPDGRFKAKVIGKYFFGAPLKEGTVSWSLKKKPHVVAAGALADAGLSFNKERGEFESEGESSSIRPLTGEGKLGADGTLDIDVALGPMPEGPASLTLEADVADSSYRHIAGRKTVIRSSTTRFAGVRVSSRFGGPTALKIDLGVVDKKGVAVAGVPVEARVERIEWKRSTTKAESGAMIETWGTQAVPEGTCTVTSATTPATCEVAIKNSGEHRIVARVDGHDGGSQWYYAWWGDGGGGNVAVPSNGKKIPATADKKAYKSGETAKVLVQSPFPEATAILTVQRGGIAKHETKRVKGPSVIFDVPMSVADAPHVHAVVTLLPIGVPDASWRVGAVKLPVSLDEAKLAVKITTDKKSYEPKSQAEVTLEVTRGGAPIKNADITLAVVDEAILRLTDFHQKDPLVAFHPARGLAFTATDTRQLLFRRQEKEKAHAAGGGDADDRENVDTRKDFVETLAWLPALTTDDKGRVKTTLKLADNLTEFRIMVTAVDAAGSAGTGEGSFIVTRPFLLDPILPGFAIKGDKLEIGAMAHNNTDAAVNAKVGFGALGAAKDVRLEPHGHARVTIPYEAAKSTPVKLSLEVDGKTKDVVEKELKVNLRGTEEHPMLTGVFRGKQEITLQIPDDVIFEEGAKLTIRTGAALYPELGHRLTYLLDYPHGCVEQTTSGLLPLLAAKNVLPWTGAEGLSDEELKKRITSGVKRLSTMKTVNGGLGFWPGSNDPHVYGTTYALRALLRAKEIGIEEKGLIEDLVAYLKKHLGAESDKMMVIGMAEVLAQAKALDEAAADPLWDKRKELDAFGTASLAIALSSLPKQEDRVKQLLDTLEASFDERGNIKEPEDKERASYRYHYYFYSADRHRAQALLALTKLRPTSKLSPILAQRLIRSIERYTTSSAAWSLMAIGAFVGNQDPSGGVDVKVKSEGKILDRTRKLGGDNKEVAIPLAELRGKKTLLLLEGDEKTPCAFALEARYARPDDKSSRHAHRAALGPSIYRVYTDPAGAPIELSKVKPGDVVRVALRVELAELEEYRAGYLAISDRFAAGFDPVQPDLSTVAAAPEITGAHPYYQGLRGWGGSASYVDVRTDRVNIYFDRPYQKIVYATYLLRAVTPGEFFLPPARGELMYEANSEGYSDAGLVTIR